MSVCSVSVFLDVGGSDTLADVDIVLVRGVYTDIAIPQ
jgi:hypothetical protein